MDNTPFLSRPASGYPGIEASLIVRMAIKSSKPCQNLNLLHVAETLRQALRSGVATEGGSPYQFRLEDGYEVVVASFGVEPVPAVPACECRTNTPSRRYVGSPFGTLPGTSRWPTEPLPPDVGAPPMAALQYLAAMGLDPQTLPGSQIGHVLIDLTRRVLTLEAAR